MIKCLFVDHKWKDMNLKVTEQVRENIVAAHPLTVEDDDGRILFEYCTACGDVRVKEAPTCDRCKHYEWCDCGVDASRCVFFDSGVLQPIWYKPWTWIYY